MRSACAQRAVLYASVASVPISLGDRSRIGGVVLGSAGRPRKSRAALGKENARRELNTERGASEPEGARAVHAFFSGCFTA